jgi:hypothetical protein
MLFSKLIFMSDKEKKYDGKQTTDDKSPRPDPETLHTTDPQEHMSGPVSSSMRGMGSGFDTDESREEADEEKEDKM